MITKAIFLDRDGTINVDKGFVYRVKDFEFLPGVIEGLQLLQEIGFLLIIITNQSGIARGYYTEDDFYNLNNWMLKFLRQHGVKITQVYFCPHHPESLIKKYRITCKCRKPALGLFEDAIKKYNIDISRSFALGDRLRDLKICMNTKCSGFLLYKNESDEIIEAVKCGAYKNIQYMSNLLSCARLIKSY